MRPRLSIITPSLNQGAFIERTILSVLDQGYENLEYVIVDGGSTDGTVEIIKRYDDRLAWWVSEPDEGQTQAINRAIEGTTGEIVAYINSDDYYLPGAFEAAVAALERSQRSWVAGASLDSHGDDPPADLPVWRPRPPSSVEHPPRGRQWWVLRPWHVSQPAAFWRRSLFEKVGLFRSDMHYAFDAEFMLRAALADEPPELLPDRPLAVRFMHPDQKGDDLRLWRPELRRFAEIHAGALTASERRRLAVIKWPLGAFFSIRDLVVHPLLRLGGRMLEAVPERLRPRIRDRDRKRDLDL